MLSRRAFLTRGTQVGLAAATAPLWSGSFGLKALAQSTAGYKAVLVIAMPGGNDGNNLLIPTDKNSYAEYCAMRGSIALDVASCNQLQTSSGSFALHPALVNVASLFNKQRAAVIANIGPLGQPVTKAQLLANADLFPGTMMSHPDGIGQWESAQTGTAISTGWGGRIADNLTGQSGSLPPLFNASNNSMFAVGQTVQAVAVQAPHVSSPSYYIPLPPALNTAVLQIAQRDQASQNQIVQQMAQFRSNAMSQQVLLDQAAASANVKTAFPGTAFGQALLTIAKLIDSRAFLGASKQIFYVQQGAYDSHEYQLDPQAQNFTELDQGLGAFFQCLDEMGVSDQVLVCTTSDFGRTMAVNSVGGTDHAWGNHHLLLGGGITGGRIIGQMPTLELGGPDDLNGLGAWVPTTSVTQLASAIGSWMGVGSAQIQSIFPDLKNFSNGPIKLV